MFETVLQPVLEAMLLAWKPSLAISSYFLLLFVTGEVLYRVMHLPTEHTRKLSHLGAGVAIMSFPWLFDHSAPVILLSLSFLGILGAAKALGLLQSIHNVQRKSAGAFYYPLAVIAMWLLSDGDPVLFCAPLAIMAVADTGAAVVGRHGEAKYRVFDGERTFEGSATFFGLAFLIVMVTLALAQRPGWPEMLLVTLVVALLTTAVEAVSVRGSDNVLIPYAAWLVLERTLRIGLVELEVWLIGMIVAAGIVVATWRAVEMTASGGLLTFVLGTLSYTLAGPEWLIPLVSLHLIFVLFRRPEIETDLRAVFPSTAGALFLVLVYAHTGSPGVYPAFLAILAANGAIAMGIWSKDKALPAQVLGVVAGALVVCVTPVFAGAEAPMMLTGGIGLIGFGLFEWFDAAGISGRRPLASLIVGLLAWALLG
jgi:phytol kinase